MLTDEQIAELKKQHGRITTVIIPYEEGDEEKQLVFYFKKADAMIRKMISKLSKGEAPERAVIAGFKNLSVAGNSVDDLQNCPDEDAMLTAEDALIEHLTVRKAIIKKN